MAYQHFNRRGDTYLLQSSETSAGKRRFYFGRKLTGTPVEAVPVGYEVFESPERAQVYLRRERPTAIEREIVAEGIRRLAPVDHFIVDVEPDSLVVYLPTKGTDEVNKLVHVLAGPDALRTRRFQEACDELVRQSDYEKMMRFGLVDEEGRLFQVDRWCFRGSLDCWVLVGGPASLSDLVEEFVGHLGAESFFELM
ncbi:MAG: hypothetical protein IH991_09855 [Planctomycetes bacterium]|nr:hypothetical protein [Planctomycetota bacterium]